VKSLLALLLAAAACSQEPAPSVTKVAEPGDVIDQDLMVALAQAKNFHHKAKVYMSDGKADEAIASVREILSLHFPAGAPEADDVRLDARALLAKLLVSKGNTTEALQVVNEGLAASPRPSFFLANLYTVKGEVHEARTAEADAANDKAKGIDERHAAIEAFDHSIKINEAIQKKLMEER
jgi:tetratricopeptide (TPR) repeat protein